MKYPNAGKNICVIKYRSIVIVLLDMEVLMKIRVFVFGVGNKTRALSVEKTLKKSEQLY